MLQKITLECYFLTGTIEQKNVNTRNDSFHNKQLITKTFFLQFRKKVYASRLLVSFEYEDDDNDEVNLDVNALQTLWGDFHTLMESLRAFPGSEEYKNPELFMQEARGWAQNFCKYTFDEDVTPYLHDNLQTLLCTHKERTYVIC